MRSLPCSAILVGAVIVLSGCRGEEPPPSAASCEPRDGATSFAAVGDSITEADSADFAGGDVGPASWVSHAMGAELSFAGGWALWGASTAAMAASVSPVEADAVVIMGGTNDAVSLPHPEIMANIEQIVARVGIDRVLVSAIPPIDGAPASATELNTALEAHAERRGWEFVDAPAGLREGDRFAAGMADDGVHPTPEGAAVLGEAIAEALGATAGCD